jgi:phospholipase C
MRSRYSLGIFTSFACVASLTVLAACAGRGALAPASPTVNTAAHVRGATTPIQHVVIITQENRTFDYMFQGYPGANTASTGKNSKGKTITLKPVPLTANYDIGHGFKSFTEAWDKGAMDGFDLEGTTGITKGYPNPEYGYAPQSEIGPYLSMAQQYVLNDNTFSSQIDSSFTAHQYLIAGQSQQAVNTPTGGPYWGCDGSGELIQTLTNTRKLGKKEAPCFDYTTLADELNNAAPQLTWRFYAPSVATQSLGSIWSA